ncbi:MAG: ATP-dependent sacrificial sulfur transferase LarE [Deltaproteobacteria bacterium]|nr:ATP-dependent sacrificial sulfur transferase LarE [Deltaproteobacteria bacterium]
MPATSSSQSKLDALRAILRAMDSVVVCYSGGVDSAFLLKVAFEELGPRCVALTAISPSLPGRERGEAESLASALGVRHLQRQSSEVADPRYAANPTDRCYFCKSALMQLAEAVRIEEQARYVLLGTNCDDLGGHRPGLKASSEAAARHPLVEAELGKQEIRELSRDLGLPTWDKPQLACLASRFPYGTAIDVERLGRVERFEDGLADLGFRGSRVRFHESVARIELPLEQLARAVEPEVRGALVALGRRLGFAYVTIDLAGYRTGAMNETLSEALRGPDEQEVRKAQRVVDPPH